MADGIRNNLLPQYDAYLRPGTPVQIGARITSLLSHFYASAIDERTGIAVALDWLRALQEFPLWAVQQVATAWLESPETGRRKPAIADIVGGCRTLVGPAVREREILQKLIGEKP